MITLFELVVLKARKRSITHCDRAKHAFANPNRAGYDAKNAALEWRHALALRRDGFR